MKSSELAMPRRQRRVWTTIASLESYEDLAQSTLDEMPTRSFEEQRAMCNALSRPRNASLAEEFTAEPVVRLRSWEEQHSHCTRLAQKPQAKATSSKPSSRLPEISIALQRRSIERLSEVRRAPLPCAFDLSDVDRDLAQLRGRRQPVSISAAGSLTPPVSPRSHHAHIKRPHSSKRPHSASKATDAERSSPELFELRKVVEELLWVSLLTLRSCSAGDCKTMSKDVATRLNGIILDVIVPVLQPMARFVVPSGSAITKRLQKEWPELISHLRLRGTTRCTWDSHELNRRSSLVPNVGICYFPRNSQKP